MGTPARKMSVQARGAGRGHARLRLVPPASSRPPQAASASVEAACRSAFRATLVLLAVLTALGLARVSLSARVAEASVDSVRLQKSIKAASRVADGLELDKSMLVTPSRIESVAAGAMRMTKAASVSYIFIPESLTAEGVPAAGAQDAKQSIGRAVAGILGAAADVTEKEARDLLVGDVGLAASE